MFESLAKFFIEKPLVTNTLCVALFAFSGIQLTRVERQGYPLVDFKEMVVIANIKGASAESMELSVTIPIEDSLADVDGILQFRSESSEGSSRVWVRLDPDFKDLDKIRNDIRNAIQGINTFPKELEQKPFIFEVRNDNFSIYEVALSHDDQDILKQHSRDLARRLRKLPAVKRVYEQGRRQAEIQVAIDPEKLARYKLSLAEVVNEVRSQSMRTTGGKLDLDGVFKNVMVVKSYQDLEVLRSLSLRSLDRNIRLDEIATIKRDFEPANESITRYNGREGVSLWVAKEGKADIIRSVDLIKAEIAKYKDSTKDSSLDIFSTWDLSIDTRNRLSLVGGNVILGFFIVLGILFLFLNTQEAFWSAFGIPVALAMVLMLFPSLDISLNTISLCGLVVVLGMVVDDAIIVSESIYRQIEQGKERRLAAWDGLRFVIRPVVFTIITTIVAFLPIYQIPGVLGEFSKEIPTVVIITLLASLIEVAFILPCHLAYGRSSTKRTPLLDPWIKKAEKLYVKLLDRCLYHRGWVVAGFFCLAVIGAFVAVQFIKFELFSDDQAYRLSIRGELDSGTSLEKTLEVAEKVDALFENDPLVTSIKTNIGGGRWDSSKASSFRIQVVMPPANQRKTKARDYKDILEQRIKDAGIDEIQKLDIWVQKDSPIGSRSIEYKVLSSDDRIRHQAIDEFMVKMKEMELSEVTNDIDKGQTVIELKPDSERTKQAGVSFEMIALVVRTAVSGSIATYEQESDDRLPVVVKLDTGSKDPLDSLYVTNQFGNQLLLADLVERVEYQSVQTIARFNGERYNTITANTRGKKANALEITNKLEPVMHEMMQKYPGVVFEMEGEAKDTASMKTQIIRLTAFAILAIYALLIVQFNSLVQPFFVIMGIPFGWIGISLAFAAHGIDLSLLAMVGIVGFSGIIVNDSLVMVDCINRLAKDSELSFATIIEGARLRLRPIILTTLTTVGGLFPTAYGLIGGLDAFISPLVMSMMWGLIFGTPAILIMVPTLYALCLKLPFLSQYQSVAPRPKA
jgi:multidrug efflux pump subunit AcrB